MKWKQLKYIFLIIFIYLIVNSINIYKFSKEYYENKSDVGIVLGAGTNNGIISPIFKERINHSLYLYNKGIIKKIIFTGGIGKNQKNSDSYYAKLYAIKKGIPKKHIYIESKSKYTIENIKESKIIMDSLNMKSALIIFDPIHMKRAIMLCRKKEIDCNPSPTKTTMYQSKIPKLKSLFYETFFYSLRILLFWK